MKYDFETIIPRRGTACEKWDALEELFGVSGDESLPMWVADMDLSSPPEVVRALEQRAAHPVYGYSGGLDGYWDAVLHWTGTRHGWTPSREALRFSPGIVSALCMLVQAFTEPGDSILFQTPVYPPVFKVIANNGRVPVNNPLVNSGGYWEMDFEDLEAKLKTGVRLMILCSPHNPVCRVWKREELARVAELCARYGTLVVSDEIHDDLVFAPREHTVFNQVGEEAANMGAVCFAASKTFNIAGLQTSSVVVENPELRERFQKILTANAVFELSPFGVVATKAAYLEGAPWLDQLLVFLKDGFEHLKGRIESEIPEAVVSDLESTHLAWVDLGRLGMTDDELEDRLLKKGKVVFNMGRTFGQGGEGHVRINFACPRAMLDNALDRFFKAVK